jgi:glucokinase
VRRQELVGFVGVDIGGHTTRVGTFDTHGQLRVLSFPTENEFATECECIAQAVRQLVPKGIKRVAVGSPGPLDWRRKRLLGKTPNLPWANVRFDQMEKLVGCEVLVDNDADVAGLGEALLGAGRGKRFIAGFTLGTGIGHFQIKDGRIYHGRLDVEAGHQILDPNGPECGCGQYGCLEAFASAIAIEKRYGVPPHELNDPKAWEEIAFRLAQGLVNTVVFVCPDVLILTGGMLARGEMLLTPLRRFYEEMLKVYPSRYRPPILVGKLGDKAGVVGAIVLAKIGRAE